MATLRQEQQPAPKAVNIIRPSSPGFRHYLKQRSSSALNYYPYHSYQHSTVSTTSSDDLHSTPSLESTSSTTSSCSSPSTLSTLSSYSGYNTNKTQLPPPTILNGFGFFQSQQNLTASPTTWFKSPSLPSEQQQSNPTVIDTTPQPLSTPTIPQTNTVTTTTTTVKALPSSGFMTPFSSRFFRVPPQQPYAADIHLQDSSGDEHSHFGPQDDDYYESIDGDTEPENSDDDDFNDSMTDYDDGDDLNDSMTDYDDEYQESDDDDDQLPIKIVAKIKHGAIIMNGKGEFVNKGGDDDRASYLSGLDEARASRKIADLEIEKSSLMALNSALESKVAQQADRISKLEKQLLTNEWPLTPVSDKDMGEYTPCFDVVASTEVLTEDEIASDLVFQRLRSMLLGLIEHAEEAVRLKTNSTGRVLTQYNGQDDQNTFTLDPPPTPPVKKSLKKQTSRQQSLPVTSSATTQQQKRPLRRSSDAVKNINRRRQPSTSSTGNTAAATTTTAATTTRKRTSMQRSLSRASSPAMLDTTTTTSIKDVPSPIVPRPSSAPMQRSSTTKPRQSHQRKSQDLESPKWHY